MVLGDIAIDEREVEVEEDCLKILALYQPVAGDLRFLVAVIKINSELERIGDLAANIAERALELPREDPLVAPASLAVMADRTDAILSKALDALVNQDAVAARCVLAADAEIDQLYRELIDELKRRIRAEIEPPRRARPPLQRGAPPGAARRSRHERRRGRPLHGGG